MKQKQSITEKLLLLFADFVDFNLPLPTIKRMQAWIAEDPRARPTRIWLEKYFREKKKQNFYSTIYRLKNEGYLKIKRGRAGDGYILTPDGEKKILKIKIRNLEKKKNPRDEWLMIIFDIPEKRKRDRNILRRFLCTLGFQKIQQSVWVSPYDIYDELKAIVNNLKLRQCIKILKVKELGEF